MITTEGNHANVEKVFNMTSTQKLLKILGYTGGTIHDLSKELGLPVNQILDIETAPYEAGVFEGKAKSVGLIVNTCGSKWIKENLLPTYYGSFNFWKAAIRSVDLGIK